MEDKKVLLSIKDLKVKFRVRGRILTAIRGISLDIYENECIAIVGESGSGKSVFTKTFAGMLDSNGFISDGTIIFEDDELADFKLPLDKKSRDIIERLHKQLNEASKLEAGGKTWQQLQELESAEKRRGSMTAEQADDFDTRQQELKDRYNNLYNKRQTYDPKLEKDKIRTAKAELKQLQAQRKALEQERAQAEKAAKANAEADAALKADYQQKVTALKAQHAQEICQPITAAMDARNLVLAKEIYLSCGRYPVTTANRLEKKLVAALTEAMRMGVDLDDDHTRSAVFDGVVFRVAYLDETADEIHGRCVLNLANVKFNQDWTHIRGCKIATVFQDPMTSLNPIITIGKQISSIIIKHQGCSEAEARTRAIQLMAKVGIPNAQNRYDDYPFQYSGGMRQRIVIAIALSCQPKILICDEPTTALDVTIQAQILQLIKDLQKEFGYTTVFITHDLGVVANVADRVAVMYAGQIVEVGNVDEVFYDPRHPYTWALLSSLPQLAQRNTELYSITGTPPSLYNEIVGDPFAPRNPYCLKIDTLAEPPMIPITPTHSAKTWLLHPDAPKVEKPEGIQNIHEKLCAAFNI